jgi:transcriptional regulator with XRE-family HTH domain
MHGMNFGTKLKHLRMEAHLSQRALAEAVGMDTAYLSRIETGAHTFAPTVDTIGKFVAALKLHTAKADELYIAAGRIPPDVESALLASPDLLPKVRRMAQRSAA